MTEVLVKQEVAVNRPASEAIAFLQNIATLEWYEPKVDAISVNCTTPQHGKFWVQGHFAGLPWRGVFAYTLHRRGFRSEMQTGPRGVSLRGGFVVKPESPETCSVTHYERYQFSGWLRPLVPLLRLLLTWSIRQEVRNVARLIEGAPGAKLSGMSTAKLRLAR